MMDPIESSYIVTYKLQIQIVSKHKLHANFKYENYLNSNSVSSVLVQIQFNDSVKIYRNSSTVDNSVVI